MYYDSDGNFCGKEFVQYLLTDGRKVNYDGSVEFFNSRSDLPPYFNELKIKRAQNFLKENIFSMFAVSLAGLISLLSNNDGIRFLIATNKSSDYISANKRYMETMKHVICWYEGDFSDGSELRKSLKTVRHMHNAAIRLGNKLGLRPIDQAELAATQFGFMGFALARQKDFGLEFASEKDLEALVHFWRVVGYMLGVKDEFNICRESIKETRLICNAAIEKIGEWLLLKEEKCLMLQFAALEGISMTVPFLNAKAFMNFLYKITIKEDKSFYHLNIIEKIKYNLLMVIIKLCKYKFIRRICNAYTYKLINDIKN